MVGDPLTVKLWVKYYKDLLVKIQIFVNYLEIVWYDAAGFIIPPSVVLDLMQVEKEREEDEDEDEDEEEEEGEEREEEEKEDISYQRLWT